MNKHLHLLLGGILVAGGAAAFQSDEIRPVKVPAGEKFCFPGLQPEMVQCAQPLSTPGFAYIDKLENHKFDNTDGHDIREINVDGEYHVAVLLVEFADTKFAQGAEETCKLIGDMLNKEGYSYRDATGSAADYYRALSGGQFRPVFDVYGPVKVSGNASQYSHTADCTDLLPDGANPDGSYYAASLMVKEAVEKANAEIDYTKYDSDKDGMVDFVYVFHAGKGATTGGSTKKTVWPHGFTLTGGAGGPVELDGVKVNRYATSGEIGEDNRLMGMGLFCHEFGHLLGLPDLYDTSNNNGTASKCFTPGTFDCMDGGNYNNALRTPPYYSVYEQYGLEWMKPVTITGGGRFTMLPLSSYRFGYKIESSSNPKEYFLLENRSNYGWDKYLEGHGLLVWHIDFDMKLWQDNRPNNNPNHMCIDLIEADNDFTANSRGGDVFPGAKDVCEYLRNVSPTFLDWANKSPGYELSEIVRNADGTVSFTVVPQSGKEMEGAYIAAVTPSMVASGATEVEVEWPAVEGAQEYRVTLFKASGFNGTTPDYDTDYVFSPIVPEADSEKGMLSAVLEGLEPNTEYLLYIYALNGVNASRMERPLSVRTCDGADFANARTSVYASHYNGKVHIEWDAVEGASEYDLAVVTRAKGDATTADEQHFTDSKLGEGWSGNGKFSTRNNYYGESAPSYNLASNGAWIASPVYEDQVSEVSFWARKRFDEDCCHLDVYGVDEEGKLRLVESVKDFDTTSKTFKVEFPAGYHAVRMQYFFRATELDFYIDDIKVNLTSAHTDVPAAGMVSEDLHECGKAVSGLVEGTEYVAYVTPKDASGTQGARSVELVFRPENLKESGVDYVAPEKIGFEINGRVLTALEPVDVFAIDGLAIAGCVKGKFTLPTSGAYVVRSGAKSVKLLVK